MKSAREAIMAQALAMRATSFVASAILLGALALLALSATWAVQRFVIFDPPAEVSMVEPPAPPEPVKQRPLEPPPQNFETTALDLPPAFTDASAEPTQTTSLPPIQTGPVTIERPHWLQRPRDLARYYPRRAVARETEGEAVLDCIVATSGRLACRVMSETPRGWGFGDAALAIAADHRMAPATRNGAPVEGRYTMRVPFELN
jgi:protein TonB